MTQDPKTLTRTDMQEAIAMAQGLPVPVRMMALLYVNTMSDGELAKIGAFANECFEFVKAGDVEGVKGKLKDAGVPEDFISIVADYGLRAAADLNRE